MLLSDELPLTSAELHAQRADPAASERDLRLRQPFVLTEAAHWAQQNRFALGAGSIGRP
jgi:hypothetical protein